MWGELEDKGLTQLEDSSLVVLLYGSIENIYRVNEIEGLIFIGELQIDRRLGINVL